MWLAELVTEDHDEELTEQEIDALFEATQPIGNAINALVQAEAVLYEAAARAGRASINEPIPPVPDWAGEVLRRLWPTLTPDDRASLLADRDAAVLRTISAQLRTSDSVKSLGARPGGMFALDADPAMRWRAERFEEPWNGWATPVVTRETMENLFSDLEPRGKPGTVGHDGTITVYRGPDDDGEYEIRPDDVGMYHLAELGWMFIEVD